jgi:hypothetical protein
MTTTNIQTRQPSKMDYASPTQFRLKIAKLPQVEFFVQTANIPGISITKVDVETTLNTIPFPGDEVIFQDLAISFLVDENLNNYKEIHDWIIGLGAPQSHTQFSDLRALSSDRFPGTTASTAATGTSTARAIPEGGIYSDATLTILNSKNIAKTEVRFHNIFPTRLGSLSYSAKTGDVDYLTASVDFNYMYYEIVQISTT